MAGCCYHLIELRMVELRHQLTVLTSYARLRTGVWPLLPWFPLSPSSPAINEVEVPRRVGRWATGVLLL